MNRKPTKQQVFTTPVGTASFPHLNEADEFQGKRTYNCKLILDGTKTETQKFLTDVNKFAHEAMKFHLKYETEALAKMPVDNSPKGKSKRANHEAMVERLKDISNFKLPIEEEYDRDTGEATGNYILKVKNNESYKRDGVEQSLKPRLFDTVGAQIAPQDEPLITGGAKLRIKTQLVSYCAGGSIGADH